MFGRESKLPIDVMFGKAPDQKLSTNEYTMKLRNSLESSYHTVRDRLKLTQRRQKNLYDKRARGSPFDKGDLVWVHSPAVPRGKSPKFHCPWNGPYCVKKKINDVLYRVKDVKNPRRTTVVHFDRLKPCYSHSQSSGENTGNSTDRLSSDATNPPVDTNDTTDPLTDYATNPPSDTNDTTDPLTDDYDYYQSIVERPPPVLTNHETNPPSTGNPPLRRSTRTTRPPERYGDFVTHNIYTRSCALEGKSSVANIQ